MALFHISRTAIIAICATSALLCASCATGARETSEKKSPKEIAQLYTNLGTESLLRGEYNQSVEDLRKALTIDDKNAIAHNHIGLAYYNLGQKEAAKAEIKRAIELDPSYSDAHINLGSMAAEVNDYETAKKEFRKALDNLEYKHRHRALTNLAQLALRENNIDEARRLVYQSLQVNPDFCLSRFILGSIYMRDNNPVRAAEEFRKSVVNTCTGNVEGHYQMGLAYMKAQQYAKARSAFVLLVDQFPQTVQAQRAGDLLKDIP